MRWEGGLKLGISLLPPSAFCFLCGQRGEGVAKSEASGGVGGALEGRLRDKTHLHKHEPTGHTECLVSAQLLSGVNDRVDKGTLGSRKF